ncbi:MAG: YqjF family protein [Gemmatimonadota bacterium]
MTSFLSAMRRQAAVLREQDHRPWPVPAGPWVMAQTWEDLLFLHWRVATDPVRALLPAGLALDTFDGDAWLGVTPFRLRNLRGRALPPVPGVSAFLELNVRTYVTAEDRPGVFFFSLDASNAAAVEGARRLYGLPYFRARMSAIPTEHGIEFVSRRDDPRGGEAELKALYGPAGPATRAAPGSLEAFLVERYCLYAIGPRARLLRAEIHHLPWPLQPGRAALDRNTMAPRGVRLGGEPLLHFARRLDVLVWPPHRVEALSSAAHP